MEFGKRRFGEDEKLALFHGAAVCDKFCRALATPTRLDTAETLLKIVVPQAGAKARKNSLKVCKSTHFWAAIQQQRTTPHIRCAQVVCVTAP